MRNAAVGWLCSGLGVSEEALPLPASAGDADAAGASASAAGDGAASTSTLPAAIDAAGEAAPRWQSLCRLLTRRAAARTYLKQYGEALADYQRALALATALGEEARAAQLAADVEKVADMKAAAVVEM